MKKHPHGKAGFSLVEMLVVIALIGIIAAIVVPNIGKMRDSAKDASIRRNAQNLANVYTAAQAAGHDFAYEDGDPSKELLEEDEIILAIIEGAVLTASGPLNGTAIGVRGLEPTLAVDNEIGAAKYLEWDEELGGLVYGESDD